MASNVIQSNVFILQNRFTSSTTFMIDQKMFNKSCNHDIVDPYSGKITHDNIAEYDIYNIKIDNPFMIK